MKLNRSIFTDERVSAEDVIFQVGVYLITLSLVLFVFIPIAIVMSVSITPPDQLFSTPASWLPGSFTLQWWLSGFAALRDGLVNSLIISVGTSLLAMAVTVSGAYVFGRKEFRGKQFVFYAIVLSLLFPSVVLVVPVTTRWLEWGLYDSYIGLWIAFQIFITPFAIWILRDYFSGLPENIEEAARVYGCTEFGAFVRVILPIAKPALIAVGFLAFLQGWNEFLFANLLTTSNGVQPAIVELYSTLHGGQGESIAWGRLMAQSLIIAIPPVILYFFSQRSLGGIFE